MSKKTRQELKAVFKQGGKPSGDDFHNFIDSVVNIDDDGIERLQGTNEPLKVLAQGETERLLDFTKSKGEVTWRINQKPDEKRSGLNITNAQDISMFFMESAAGNLGLGTEEPKARLHVLQSGNAAALRIDDAEKDTTPFLIDMNGNVGIGVDAPKAKLEVAGDLRISGSLTTGVGAIGNPHGDDWAAFSHKNQCTKNGYGLLHHKSGQTLLNAAKDQSINFRINNQNQMYLSKEGKLGINNFDPKYRLDVDGSLRITGNLITGVGTIGNPHGDDWAAFAHKDQCTKNGFGLLHNKNGRTLLNAAKDQALHFQIDNKDQMYLSKDGNLGIGTTDPKHKLDVDGGLRISGDLTTGVGAIANTHGDDWAAFTHKDQCNKTGYGLLHNKNGRTILNAAKDQCINFRIENSDKMYLSKDGQLGIGKSNPRVPLDVNGEIRGKIWYSKEYKWGQGDNPVKMGPTKNCVAFLTHVRGKFEGSGEYVDIYAKDGYWYLSGGSQQNSVQAKAICIGMPW